MNPNDRDPTRYCERTGKRRFDSERQAKRIAGRFGTRVRTYRCEFCRSIHITKEKNRRRGRGREGWRDDDA